MSRHGDGLWRAGHDAGPLPPLVPEFVPAKQPAHFVRGTVVREALVLSTLLGTAARRIAVSRRTTRRS